MPNFLRSVTWISGPEFLHQTKSEWPKTTDSDLTLTPEDPEVKVLVSNVAVVGESGNSINRMLSWYSNWHLLKRAVAWILRVKATLKLAIAKKKDLPGNKKDTGQASSLCARSARS